MIERTFARFDSQSISLDVRISFAALVKTHLLGGWFVVGGCLGDVPGGGGVKGVRDECGRWKALSPFMEEG